MNSNFIETAKENLNELVESGKLDNFYCSSLQDFKFVDSYYNLIWIQWVLLYLVDTDLIDFLKRAKNALVTGGIIIIKENHTNEGFFVDNQDNSITRSEAHFKNIFTSANLKLIKEERQSGFPNELFPVTMYALN